MRLDTNFFLWFSLSVCVSEFDRRHVITRVTRVTCNLRVRSGDVTNSLIGSDLLYPERVRMCQAWCRITPQSGIGINEFPIHGPYLNDHLWYYSYMIWCHHPVFKYHPIETTRFFIIWLEVNGTAQPPSLAWPMYWHAPSVDCVAHQWTISADSAALSLDAEYCSQCCRAAVAAEITRTLQNIEWETCSRPN